MVAALNVFAVAPAEALSGRQFAYPGYSINWHRDEGLPGDKSRHGLHMAKDAVTTEDSPGAGLALGDVDGPTIHRVGFAIDGGCLGDQPMFHIVPVSGPRVDIGCTDLALVGTTGTWQRRELHITPIEFDRISLRFRLPLTATGVVHVDDIVVNSETMSGPNGK